jgi:hypothetical protein
MYKLIFHVVFSFNNVNRVDNKLQFSPQNGISLELNNKNIISITQTITNISVFIHIRLFDQTFLKNLVFLKITHQCQNLTNTQFKISKKCFFVYLLQSTFFFVHIKYFLLNVSLWILFISTQRLFRVIVSKFSCVYFTSNVYSSKNSNMFLALMLFICIQER